MDEPARPHNPRIPQATCLRPKRTPVNRRAAAPVHGAELLASADVDGLLVVQERVPTPPSTDWDTDGDGGTIPVHHAAGWEWRPFRKYPGLGRELKSSLADALRRLEESAPDQKRIEPGLRVLLTAEGAKALWSPNGASLELSGTPLKVLRSVARLCAAKGGEEATARASEIKQLSDVTRAGSDLRTLLDRGFLEQPAGPRTGYRPTRRGWKLIRETTGR